MNFSKIRKAPTLIISLLILLCAAINGPVQAGDQRLEGMWEIVGTPDPLSGVPPFINLVQMSHDGHLVNVDPSEGASIGEWARIGHNQYSVKFYGFIPLGMDTGRFVVNGTLEVDPGHNTLQGSFVTDVSIGAFAIFSFAGTIEGSRL